MLGSDRSGIALDRSSGMAEIRGQCEFDIRSSEMSLEAVRSK